jgi:anti-sigma factor RsiW
MKTPTFRDIEQLSAFLDGQLSSAEKTRLESRLAANPELGVALDDLRQARAILRRTPQRRAPRNFTLTPRMAGIRPPVPRAVPAFSWASAIAMLLFVCTLGTNLLGQFSFGAAAPMMAAAPEYGIGGGPPATEAPLDTTANSAYATATPEMSALTVAGPTAAPGARDTQPPQTKAPWPISPWLVLWPSLAVLFLGAALLIRWLSQQTFKRKMSKK